MIELVTQAYMLMAPVGVGIVLYCVAGLIRGREERSNALYRRAAAAIDGQLRKLWIDGGYSGAAIVDPSKVRPPSSPSGVQRIGDYKPTKTQLERVEPSPDRVPPRGGSGVPKMKPGEGIHG